MWNSVQQLRTCYRLTSRIHTLHLVRKIVSIDNVYSHRALNKQQSLRLFIPPALYKHNTNIIIHNLCKSVLLCMPKHYL